MQQATKCDTSTGFIELVTIDESVEEVVFLVLASFEIVNLIDEIGSVGSFSEKG
jgi:hypothetical protein